MHPVVKVLWMIGVGIILGSIFVSTVFHIYSDWYISLVLIAAALPIMAAVITDAYVRQLDVYKRQDFNNLIVIYHYHTVSNAF